MAAAHGLWLLPLLLLVVACNGWMPSPSPGPSQGWPQLGFNDQHTGVCPYSGPAGPNVAALWVFQTGAPCVSSPAVGSGMVFFGSGDGGLYAVDASTGKQVWVMKTGGAVNSSPALSLDGSSVYVGSEDGSLYALASSTGALLWTFKTGAAVEGSPVVAGDGSLFISSTDHYLYALTSSGSLRWRFATQYQIWGTPAVGADGTVYVGSLDGVLYALNGSTGAKVWSFTSASKAFPFYSTPVLANGLVYIGSDGSWAGYVLALEASSGSLVWNATTLDSVRSSVAVTADGSTVVVGCQDAIVYNFDALTGDLRWNYTAGTGGQVESSPVIDSSGAVYIATHAGAGTVHALDVETGAVRWAFALSSGVCIDCVGITSTPVVGPSGTVYVGGYDGALYALQTGPA